MDIFRHTALKDDGFEAFFVELNVQTLCNPGKLTEAFLFLSVLVCFLLLGREDGWLTSELTDWLAELRWSQLLSWPKARR